MIVDSIAIRNVILPTLKFKPYGAIKLANTINKGFTIFGSTLGIGIEIWDSYTEEKKKHEFNKAINNIATYLVELRDAYYNLFNDSTRFIQTYYPDYYELINNIVRIA